MWTVALKMLSPAVVSGATPLSSSVMLLEAPMLLASRWTARPVLVGLAPGTTVTIATAFAPALPSRHGGEMVALALGGCGPVQEKLSTWTPARLAVLQEN